MGKGGVARESLSIRGMPTRRQRVGPALIEEKEDQIGA